MIRARSNLGCATGGSCCSSCRAHSLGDATDSSSFTDFLNANPDAASAVSAWQTTNASDPNLQTVMYNPITNTIGPVTLTPQATTDATAAPATGNTNSWGILGLSLGLIAVAFAAGRK